MHSRAVYTDNVHHHFTSSRFDTRAWGRQAQIISTLSINSSWLDPHIVKKRREEVHFLSRADLCRLGMYLQLQKHRQREK